MVTSGAVVPGVRQIHGEVLVVATAPVAAGFRLAGVRADAPLDDHAVHDLLLTPPRDIALLLVEEPLLATLSAAERDRLDRRATPVLVPFPAAGDGGPAADTVVLDLLRRAIGYRVRLQ